MIITERPRGTVMVYHLAGNLAGGADDEKMRKRISKLIDDGYYQLVLSFRLVSFIGSAGLGILLASNKKFEAAGGRIILCNLNERVLSVIHVTRLHTYFNVTANINTALSAFAARRKAAAAEA